MKKFLPILLFLTFSGLTLFLNPELLQEENQSIITSIASNNQKTFNNSIAKNNPYYKIDAEYKPKSKMLTVNQSVTWINNSDTETSELYFILPQNAYRNNSYYATEHKLDPEEYSKLEFKSVRVEREDSKINFLHRDNFLDSTVARVKLNTIVNPGDTVSINLSFDVKIPRASNSLGSATGRDFTLFAGWYCVIDIFNGEWSARSIQPFAERNKLPAAFEVKIDIPKDYKIISSGNLIDSITIADKKIVKYFSENVNDFAWAVSREILVKEQTYNSKFGKEIKIRLCIQPENEIITSRYLKAIESGMDFLESSISEFPYENLNLVDLPRTYFGQPNTYSNLITVSTEMFSPVITHQPEDEIFENLAKIYFKEKINVDPYYDSWLTEGIPAYISSVISDEYLGREQVTFKLASYVPISGLIFLSYNEIPLIYTLGEYEKEISADAIEIYYSNSNVGSISDPAYKFPTKESFDENVKVKSEILLLSLENYAGRNNLMAFLKKYFEQFTFNTATSESFFNLLKNELDSNSYRFAETAFQCSENSDFSIVDIHQSDNSYEILLSRQGGISVENDIAVYFENDTLMYNWDAENKWDILKIESDAKMIGAEVDPHRKNLFDINFANNSYMLSPNYSSGFILALRWLFWIQNALMVLGSIG